ncbi:MAG: family 10 glycosylhydrolase [bacterium]|nr:family 10 glycosylhydrolase [bacterium]
MKFKQDVIATVIIILGWYTISFGTDFIIDDGDLGYTEVGTWTVTSAYPGYYGTTYRYGSQNATNTTRSATWRPTIDTAGNYEVFTWYVAGSNRSSTAQYIIGYAGGTNIVTISQRENGSQWYSLGTYPFTSGTTGYLMLTNYSNPTTGLVIADAAKFAYQPPMPTQPNEFRALWVDAWHDGIKTPAQTDALINTLRSNHYNAVIVQVRLRGNAYYRNSPYEPPATDLTAGYDGLADLIAKAHDTSGGKRYLEVHAAFATYPIWASSIATTGTPKHPYLAHPEWASRDTAGNIFSGSNVWFDPGVPEVQQHTFNVVYHVATAYNVDGIQLDLVRYPGVEWGYNTVAVARFNEEYGRTGQPSATDNTWRAWRRRQVTQLVKKIYASIIAVKPWVKVSAATISWGNTGTSGYLDAYNNEFQEWCEWMKNHYLDFNGNMAYDDTFSVWSSKCVFALDSAYGRHVYKILGAYMNAIDSTLAQASSLRVYQTARGLPLGVSFYSYAETNNEGKSASEFQSAVKSHLFYSAVSTPIMAWKTAPTKGYVIGTVTLGISTVDRATVSLKQGLTTVAVTSTDGTGFYAFFDITPGSNYTVTAAKSSYMKTSPSLSVSAGNVTTLNFNLLSTTKVEEWNELK